ncbi:MAG: hypothetical protein WCW35_01710 [Bacteroidota bacterium]|jgi:hypothetical protein
MNISIIDGSAYFKGLLLLIRKDRLVTKPEIQLMKRIGKTLGFELEFCDNAIRDILVNEYIIDIIPEFSSKALAEKFIKDGLAIAFSDNELHPSEEEWLRTAAAKNRIDSSWFQREHDKAAIRRELPPTLEVDDITVQYFSSAGPH